MVKQEATKPGIWSIVSWLLGVLLQPSDLRVIPTQFVGNFSSTSACISLAPLRRSGLMNDDACKTPSPDSSPASADAGSPAQKSGVVFNTITSDDWKRSLASARAQPNVAWQQIQIAISSQSPKTPSPSSS